jgi:hypothetical protein
MERWASKIRGSNMESGWKKGDVSLWLTNKLFSSTSTSFSVSSSSSNDKNAQQQGIHWPSHASAPLTPLDKKTFDDGLYRSPSTLVAFNYYFFAS